MKRVRKIVLIALAAMMLMAFAGCANKEIDWESIKRDDVVAQAGGVQLEKKVVNFQYNIDVVSSQYTSSLYSQMGEEYEPELSMDLSFQDLLSYLALASVAEEQGLMISEEEARESAYEEFILSAKKLDYLAEYTEGLKQAMFLSDELIVEYGADYGIVTDSADEVVKAEFDKLDPENYEDLDAMAGDVLETVKQLAEDVQITVFYPSQHTVKGSTLDYEAIVDTVKWNYSALF